MFLFILGCMIVKGPMKWALVAGTVFSIVLSWGKNFMGVTDFFIDYVPMYNKFRAVSSILVIAEFTIPLLAIMALKEIIDRPAVLKERAKAFYLSLGLTGGLSLLFALAPRFFFSSYVSSMEMGALQNSYPDEPGRHARRRLYFGRMEKLLHHPDRCGPALGFPGRQTDTQLAGGTAHPALPG